VASTSTTSAATSSRDGIITDYPDRLRALMADNGFKLPKAYAAR
jgi:hypothetical protein